MAGPGVDPRIIEAEEAEYAQADCIIVPSQFAYRSFLSQGVAPDKLRLLPYGVDLSRFEPAGVPPEGTFDVLFVGAMSPRKGVQYLVQAFQQIRHPAKTLSFVGAPSSESRCCGNAIYGQKMRFTSWFCRASRRDWRLCKHKPWPAPARWSEPGTAEDQRWSRRLHRAHPRRWRIGGTVTARRSS